MKKSKKYQYTGLLLTLPVLIGCLIFYVISFVMVVKNSLYSGVGAMGVFKGFENYKDILNNGMFRTALWNTVRFLLISLPLMLILAFFIAWLLKSQVNRFKFLKSVLLFPYIMPVVGTVLIVQYIFSPYGLTAKLMNLLGLPVTDWLNSSKAFVVVVLLYLWKNVGYSIILLLAGLTTIPDDQYTTADMDGANGLQKLIYITLPQMKFSIFMTLLFSLINAFKCFREIFLIGGEHPNRHIYMLQHFINNCFENLNLNRLSAASVVFTLMLILVISVSYAILMKKEAE